MRIYAKAYEEPLSFSPDDGRYPKCSLVHESVRLFSYVTAIDGITRIALLAGPYPTKDMAERVVRKVSAWAIDESGDLKAVFYAYSVSKRYHGHDRSILGMIEP